jgi:WD40 repeat protein
MRNEVFAPLLLAAILAPPTRLSGQEANLELVLQTRHTDAALSVSLSDDGQRVLTGSRDKSAILWDAASGAQLRTLAGHNNDVNGVALSSDGQLALTGCEDQTAILWDTRRGTKLQTFKGPSGWVRSVALSGDGQRALISSGSKAILWDTRSNGKLCTFGLEAGDIALDGVCLSRDGQRVLTPSLVPGTAPHASGTPEPARNWHRCFPWIPAKAGSWLHQMAISMARRTASTSFVTASRISRNSYHWSKAASYFSVQGC